MLAVAAVVVVVVVGLESADLLLWELEGLDAEHLELLTWAGLDTADRRATLGLETGDFALQWLGGLDTGDLMLLSGLERGEPTLLACAGLCDLEPRASTFGEQATGVPWATGLCTVKLPKLAGAEDAELSPAGLHAEGVTFRGLRADEPFS